MTTPRASLPELSTSQAAKETVHNEALRILEALTVGGVVTLSLSTPPATPAEGGVWVVGASATDAWAGKENQLAHYTNGAWAFYVPADGWHIHVIDEDKQYFYTGTAWAAYAAPAQLDSVQENVAAAGTTSATATAATDDMVEVTTSTAATADGIRLRTIVQGEKQVIFNKTANALNVYPPTGKQINLAGADVAHSLQAWGTVTYYAVKSDSYYT